MLAMYVFYDVKHKQPDSIECPPPHFELFNRQHPQARLSVSIYRTCSRACVPNIPLFHYDISYLNEP